MNFEKTIIDGVFIITTEPFIDERGFFERIYCKKEFSNIVDPKEFVQFNHSFTKEKGTIRGLHYQLPPKKERKIVKCIRGKIFDVVVDVRANSPTYFQWIAVELSDKNRKMIYIPEGCAHGFQTLVNNCELIYFHTQYYCKELEKSIFYNDLKLNIGWPMTVTKISEKDLNA
ncbi:MAG: dTDP-4-dehydrorhamnose 3,5-epimerase [Melioribacteraceae bacterium]|nr:dTDP-4-dehydrorhamnose 3,5-epimerase [Melioribacteraceae bacterium]